MRKILTIWEIQVQSILNILKLKNTCIIMFLVVYRHTAIVVYGKEFFFSGEGINNCPPVSIHVILTFPSTFPRIHHT